MRRRPCTWGLVERDLGIGADRQQLLLPAQAEAQPKRLGAGRRDVEEQAALVEALIGARRRPRSLDGSVGQHVNLAF